MSTVNENNSGKFKILVGVLSLLLIALGVYTFTLFKDNKTKISTLEVQKADIEKELEGMIANYDDLIEENNLKDKDLTAARERIAVLLDSVKDAQANVSLIERYKIEIERLKRERTLLFKKADSLIAANERLLHQRDSTTTELQHSQIRLDSISDVNKSMGETIYRASIVRATNLRGEAVIIRKNGKVVNTKRSSRADKIRACFTLLPNDVAEKGNRTLYLQVINPLNNIIGEKEIVQTEDEPFYYSATTNVFYENQELDVCIMVDVADPDLIEGNYVFNVYDGVNKVATTSMELK